MAGDLDSDRPADGIAWHSQASVDVSYSYAGLASRTCAFLVDSFILQAVPFILARIGHLPDWLNMDRSKVPLAFILAYFVLFELSPSQATPGKWCCGFFVASPRGERLPWWRVLLRNILRPFSFFFLIGPIMCIFDRRRRMPHDLIAGAAHFLIPVDPPSFRRPVWH